MTGSRVITSVGGEKPQTAQQEELASPVQKHHRQSYGLAEAAHLFQEDNSGHVTARFLIPRPTNDPNDPLTWSILRKHLALAAVSFFVFLSNYVTASVTPIMIDLVQEAHVDITKGSYLITFNILFLGIGNLFWIPLSRKIGKRPVLIASSAIFFAACIWFAKSSSYGSMLGARIIQGFGASASEALGPAVIADLYFLHERGTKVGFYTFMIASGSAFGGLFSGFVINANPNWRWVFWKNSILTGTAFLLILLLQPETSFERPEESEIGEGITSADLADIRRYSKPSWSRTLSVTAWYDRENPMWLLFWRPFTLLRYPAVVWASINYGIVLGWVVLQQTINATFYPEIYHFSSFAVGNVNVAGLVGAIVGCIVGGPLSDWLSAYISKRRGGYFEPEYRLWTLIPPFIFGPIGLMLWGGGFGDRLDPLVSVAGAGITYGVLCAVPSVGITYVVDCYKPVAGETITILTAFKNTWAFAVSFAAIPWLQRDGFIKLSGYMTLIEGMIFLTAIPMYIYGERLRRWTLKFLV